MRTLIASSISKYHHQSRKARHQGNVPHVSLEWLGKPIWLDPEMKQPVGSVPISGRPAGFPNPEIDQGPSSGVRLSTGIASSDGLFRGTSALTQPLPPFPSPPSPTSQWVSVTEGPRLRSSGTAALRLLILARLVRLVTPERPAEPRLLTVPCSPVWGIDRGNHIPLVQTLGTPQPTLPVGTDSFYAES